MSSEDPRSPDAAPDGFRPDLEGLRACAVVLVLLYHASVPGFTGGYVGVDVFFVLSGFLITGLLLREVRRTGTISLPQFYARRARRLLPASALVLLATVIASFFILPRLQVPDVAGDAAAAALYVSNIRFAFEATDYLQADLAPSPLLHFWSLGVEEQFYLFWPAFILLLARGGGDVRRRITIAAVAITVASFALSLWLTDANAPWAFFSLPTRAWELGLGALLAVGASRLARLPDAPAALAAWVGLCMVALSGVVLDTATPFPGLAALLPTIGSALVIAGGFRQSALAPGRWLSMAAPRFLGRISYSLYLWHWPVLVLPAVAVEAPLPWWARGALVLVAVGLAAATQRWVEDPLRHGRGIGTLPRRNLAMAGALSLLVAAVSLGVGSTNTAALQGTHTTDLATDERALAEILLALGPGTSTTVDRPVPPGIRPALAQARKDYPLPFGDGCHATESQTRSGRCEYGQRDGGRTMVLFGDSHALSWFPALVRIADEDGWALVVLTKSACQSVDMAQYNKNLKRLYHECAAWRDEAFARIAQLRPELVVVTNTRGFRASDPSGGELTGEAATAAWRDGVSRTLTRLAGAARRTVVIADVPLSRVDPPVCLSDHPESILACATPYERAVEPGWIEQERTAASAGGAGFIDPTTWVCPSRPCPPVLGNFLVLKDTGHMTTAFAAALAGRLREGIAAP